MNNQTPAVGRPSDPANIDRIKENITKMIDLGAPEADIDAYVAEEGISLGDLQSTPPPKSTAKPAPATAPQGAKPLGDARTAIQSLFPQARITDWRRPADSPLGRANPSSFHVSTGAAVDLAPIPGMTFDQARAALEAKGYPLIEAIDEVKNPSGHATGKHWHFVLGEPEGGEPQGLMGDVPQPERRLSPEAEGRYLALLNDPNTPADAVAQFVQENGGAVALSDIEAFKQWQAKYGGDKGAVEYAPQPPAITPEQTNGATAAALGLGDAATFGFLDELGAAVDTIGLTPGRENLWNSDKSAKDILYGNIDANRDKLSAAQEEHGAEYLGGNIAGSLVPFGGGFKAAQSAGALGKLRATAATGAAYGAAYGAGSDEGSLADRLDGALEGAGIGAAGGTAIHVTAKALTPVAQRLLPKLADARFVREQSANPYRVTDAKIASDLDKLVGVIQSASGQKKLTGKAGRQVLLNRVAELEESYLPANEIAALDIAPSVKAKLKAAMAKRHLLADEEVAALRDGTVAGDATAEGIEKARRLRAYVSDAGGPALTGGRMLAEALGSAAGWKLGGPLGGAAGGVLGRAVAPSASRKAAKDALGLAKQAPRFAKLPEVIAARESGDGDKLATAVSEALDAPFIAKLKAKREAKRAMEEGRKVSKTNALDNVTPGGGFRGYVYERTGLLPADQDTGALAALAEGKITQGQFDAFLEAPEKLMEGNAGNAIVDRLNAMAEAGKLTRDPKWSPRSATGEGDGIRNPLAYGATAQANQARVTAALLRVQGNEAMSLAERETLATAITKIGNLSNRKEANEVATDALDRLSPEERDYALSVLSPLLGQIKR